MYESVLLNLFLSCVPSSSSPVPLSRAVVVPHCCDPRAFSHHHRMHFPRDGSWSLCHISQVRRGAGPCHHQRQSKRLLSLIQKGSLIYGSLWQDTSGINVVNILKWYQTIIAITTFNSVFLFQIFLSSIRTKS